MTRSPHISTRQYTRVVKPWVARIGLDPGDCGTQLHAPHQGDADLPGERRISGRFSYYSVIPSWKVQSDTGIEVDDALEMSEQTEV